MRERQHAAQLRDLTTFAVNMTRLNLSEWMRLGIRLSLPEVDREIEAIQAQSGVTRDRAVQMYADRLGGYGNGEQ